MTRPFLRLSLLLIILFAAALTIIRAQPYDDHQLRELLLPAGCPAPCFMGIQPGVTTVEEAVKILEASEWVEDYQLDGQIFTVRWNNNSPSWLANNSLYGGSSIRVAGNLVMFLRWIQALRLVKYNWDWVDHHFNMFQLVSLRGIHT